MYDLPVRQHALTLVRQGRSLNSVSKETGISRAAIRSWVSRLEPLPNANGGSCSLCGPDQGPPSDHPAYAYLLGLYLGDGCISALRNTELIRVTCANAWPGLITACEQAIRAVHPRENSVFRVRRQGCVNVSSYGRHWTCLFPQHGPGKKHERSIALETWQEGIVNEQPWHFLRGLIHSDGARVINWTTRIVRGERRRYEYPRYFFTNTSTDIIGLFTSTLDRVGVEWKDLNQSRRAVTISVARRRSVALMDRYIGPKY